MELEEEFLVYKGVVHKLSWEVARKGSLILIVLWDSHSVIKGFVPLVRINHFIYHSKLL